MRFFLFYIKSTISAVIMNTFSYLLTHTVTNVNKRSKKYKIKVCS